MINDFNIAIDNRDKKTIDSDNRLNKDIDAEKANKGLAHHEQLIGLYIKTAAENNLTSSLKNIVKNHKQAFATNKESINFSIQTAISKEHFNILSILLDAVYISQTDLKALIRHAVLEDCPSAVPILEKHLTAKLNTNFLLLMTANNFKAKSLQFFVDRYQDEISKQNLIDIKQDFIQQSKINTEDKESVDRIIAIFDQAIIDKEKRLKATQLSKFKKKKTRIKNLAEGKRISGMKR